MESNQENETNMRQFARQVWPGITRSTTFVMVPEGQMTVTCPLSSGKVFEASLTRNTAPSGRMIFGYYDDENDVCYIGKFVE